MIFNKLCNVEDWADLRIADVPKRRKAWELALARRALGDVTGQEILNVGSGNEPTSFRLCNEGVRRVWAIDLYGTSGGWRDFASPQMLIDPASCCSFPFDAQRLTVQHMDARYLRFPDGMFDQVFSLSSIEHFGDDIGIAQAAREIGRVLKPGGRAVIATEYKISGPSAGWPGVRLFTQQDLDALILEPSGLRRVDGPDWTLSGDTLLTSYPLQAILDAWHQKLPVEHDDVVLEHRDHRFTSVMLVLEKP